MRNVLISVVLVVAGVAFTATPASAAPFSCELAGFAAAGVDLPIAASGPATVVVGETNRYNLDLSFAGVIPEQFATISGVANSAEATLKLPSGIQVDPATATVTGGSAGFRSGFGATSSAGAGFDSTRWDDGTIDLDDDAVVEDRLVDDLRLEDRGGSDGRSGPPQDDRP